MKGKFEKDQRIIINARAGISFSFKNGERAADVVVETMAVDGDGDETYIVLSKEKRIMRTRERGVRNALGRTGGRGQNSDQY